MRTGPRLLHLLLVTAVAAASLVATSPDAPALAAAEVSAPSSPEETSSQSSSTLTYDSPHASVTQDAGSGEWTFLVEGNQRVESVRLSVAEGGCSSGGTTLWETKVTDDELKSGGATRTAAFDQGLYCSHLLLDGTRQATATVTITIPQPPVAEPDPDPGSSAEYDRCTDDPEVDHRVLAGATGPDPDAPFIYQKFYPSTLQVHQGDIVEWCFNGAYDWHTVSFSPLEMDVAQHPDPVSAAVPRWWRWDETGQKAFHEQMLFGHEGGNEAEQCGRGPYWHLEAQPPCKVTTTAQEVSSSLWDRFFSTGRPGTFRIEIGEELDPGLYRYRCKIHASMVGYLEVVVDDIPLLNPSISQLSAEINGDYLEAQEVLEALSDPSDAYDFNERRWNVLVGATTPDRSVAIEQFLPARIDVRKGDTVHFIAGSDEPNTVTFPGGRQVGGSADSNLQGGFSQGGECGPHSCRGGTGAPWGMTGLAFTWTCDADDRGSGSAVALPYVPAATVGRVPAEQRPSHGCVAGGLPEMVTQPWYADQQRAPGDLVVSQKTYHNSGTILDRWLPEQVRSWESDGILPPGTFPDAFDATFPTQGTFQFFCAAHEFMNGAVVVR